MCGHEVEVNLRRKNSQIRKRAFYSGGMEAAKVIVLSVALMAELVIISAILVIISFPGMTCNRAICYAVQNPFPFSLITVAISVALIALVYVVVPWSTVLHRPKVNYADSQKRQKAFPEESAG
jgi:Na+/H+ antiporter NhaB